MPHTSSRTRTGRQHRNLKLTERRSPRSRTDVPVLPPTKIQVIIQTAVPRRELSEAEVDDALAEVVRRCRASKREKFHRNLARIALIVALLTAGYFTSHLVGVLSFSHHESPKTDATAPPDSQSASISPATLLTVPMTVTIVAIPVATDIKVRADASISSIEIPRAFSSPEEVRCKRTGEDVSGVLGIQPSSVWYELVGGGVVSSTVIELSPKNASVADCPPIVQAPSQQSVSADRLAAAIAHKQQ